MADTLKLRRGNTAACNSFTGVEGEIVIDTTKKTVVVQDGTAGGEPLMKESGTTAASTITLGTGGTTALTIDASQNLKLPDYGRVYWGNGDDLEVYHHAGGTSNVIKNNEGDLVVTVSNDFYLKHGTDKMFAAYDEAGCELYWDNVVKFSTKSSGAILTGALELTDTLKLFDTNSPNDENVHIFSIGDACTVRAFGTDGAFEVETGSSNTLALTVDNTQKATFEGDVQVSGDHLNLLGAYISFSGSLGSTPETAAAIYRPADNTLAISTANTLALTIDANQDATFIGNIDLNPNAVSTAGSPKLTLTNGSQVSGGRQYSLRPNRPGVSNTGFTIYNESDERNELSIDGSGNVTFEGNVKLNAAKGINFSNYGAEEDPDVTATDVTSNTLDDYEEGTFMPTLAQGGDDGSGGDVSYSLRAGHYTKIGNKVHVDFYMYFAAGTKSTNAPYVVGGLPFTTKNANYIRGGGCTTYHNLATDAGGSNAVVALYGSTNSTQVQLYQGSTQVKGADGSDLGGKYLIGFYEYLAA